MSSLRNTYQKYLHVLLEVGYKYGYKYGSEFFSNPSKEMSNCVIYKVIKIKIKYYLIDSF